MKTPNWTFAQTLPVFVMETREETLAFLANPTHQKGLYKYRVASLYVCDFMDAMESEGFVYNSVAQRKFEQVHALPASPESGSVLSVLIYNNQQYRRARKLEMDGWKPVTAEVLVECHQTGKTIIVEGEGNFGTVRETLSVRKAADGKLHVFRPRKRKPLNVWGLPCKLIAA